MSHLSIVYVRNLSGTWDSAHILFDCGAKVCRSRIIFEPQQPNEDFDKGTNPTRYPRASQRHWGQFTVNIGEHDKLIVDMLEALKKKILQYNMKMIQYNTTVT